MPRNLVYLVVAALAVTSAILGYRLYQERQKPEGVDIRMDDRGISIERR